MIDDNAALRAQVRDSYATPASLEVYRTRVDRGLRIALMREVRRVLRPGGAATFSAHDDARTRPGYDPGDIVVADAPEPGDLVIHERREAATRYCHLFSRDELTALCRDAGFTDSVLRHTSDLGETWDNVFVGVCR